MLPAGIAREIAVEAYIYAYPLVLMEITRRVATNVEAPTAHGRAPMNQFSHVRERPDATVTDVVRPNVDTLDSSLWLDVSGEPLVFTVPASGRHYVLPILDMWTDVFASPGSRTTGQAAYRFAVAGPGWQGTLPPGVDEIRSPTSHAWMIGRTQSSGTHDDPQAHAFQDGIGVVPLSRWGRPHSPTRNRIDPRLDMRAPGEQIHRMSAATFFETFARAAAVNPPHANDYPILARLRRIGLQPGKPFDWAGLPPAVKMALDAAPTFAAPQILESIVRSSRVVRGWSMVVSPIGTYGTDYVKRAGIAYFGLGATTREDAFSSSLDERSYGEPLDSDARYVVHLDRIGIPPVRAFWSITMYDERRLLTANPIDRHAIGDRDRLAFNADGSLDIYVQRESPGVDREANWLPTPAKGSFSMTLRLYWPRPEALDGRWSPPTVTRVG